MTWTNRAQRRRSGVAHRHCSRNGDAGPPSRRRAGATPFQKALCRSARRSPETRRDCMLGSTEQAFERTRYQAGHQTTKEVHFLEESAPGCFPPLESGGHEYQFVCAIRGNVPNYRISRLRTDRIYRGCATSSSSSLVGADFVDRTEIPSRSRCPPPAVGRSVREQPRTCGR